MKNQVNPVVLYDGSCPLCSREIAHYQRRAGAEEIVWIDASTNPEELNSLGISQQQAMQVFHVRDSHLEWQRGASAFLVIWSHLPAYRWLAKLINFLRLTPVLDWGYRYFLRWRNRNHCNSDNNCSTRAG